MKPRIDARLRVLEASDDQEKRRTRALYEKTFGDPQDFTDYYYADKCRDNRMVIAESPEGEILSMAHLNPYTVSVCGTEVQSYYVVAVATDERFRHQGLMASVLQHAFEILQEEHVPFIWLLPVDPAIYAPFAFKVVADFCTDRLPMEDVAADYDVYCVRDAIYERRVRMESMLAGDSEHEGESNLPKDPKIMVRVISETDFADLLPAGKQLSTLKWYFCEEV